MKKRSVQKSLKGLGACYEIDHQAICRALAEESPELLEAYGEDNPVGSFVFFSDSGIRFIPSHHLIIVRLSFACRNQHSKSN